MNLVDFLGISDKSVGRISSFLSPIMAFMTNVSNMGSSSDPFALISNYWLSNVALFTVFGMGLIGISISIAKRRMHDR